MKALVLILPVTHSMILLITATLVFSWHFGGSGWSSELWKALEETACMSLSNPLGCVSVSMAEDDCMDDLTCGPCCLIHRVHDRVEGPTKNRRAITSSKHAQHCH